MKRKPKPLWRCPKCGKYYVTRNMWHACARHSLAAHFARRDPKLKLLFDGFVGLVRRCGPVRIVPGKTGIAFQQRMRFAGVFVRKNYLEAGFVLPRRLDHPRIKKMIAYTPRAYGHHVELRSPEDLDYELAAWLRESYRVGQQADLLAGRKTSLREKGEFTWSEPFFSKARCANTARPRPPNSSCRGATQRTKPLWECPQCGRAFGNANQIHICSQLTLAQALRGETPQACALFRRVAAISRGFGPVKTVPQKTRVALQARRIFLGVRFLRDAIECELALPQRIEHPRFAKILSASPLSHYHYLRISSGAELDRDLRSWLREAYRSGQQLHLTRRSD